MIYHVPIDQTIRQRVKQMCQVQQWGDGEEKDAKECGYDFYEVKLFTFLIFYIFLFTFLIVVQLRGVYGVD